MSPHKSIICSVLLLSVLSPLSVNANPQPGDSPYNVSDVFNPSGDQPKSKGGLLGKLAKVSNSKEFKSVQDIAKYVNLGAGLLRTTGLNVTPYLNYPNILLGLMSLQQKSDPNNPNPDAIAESQSLLEVLGAAGLPDPEKAKIVFSDYDLDAEADSENNIFGVPPALQKRISNNLSQIKAGQAELNLLLGSKGQELIKSARSSIAQAVASSASIADQAEQATSSQDVLKLARKQEAETAKIGQATYEEAVQTRAAIYQGNKQLYNLAEIAQERKKAEQIERSFVNSGQMGEMGRLAGLVGPATPNRPTRNNRSVPQSQLPRLPRLPGSPVPPATPSSPRTPPFRP